MLRTRFIVMSLLALTLLLTACGGGTSGLIDNDLGSGDSFKAVRYNDAGSIDNSIVDIQAVNNGDLTTVIVSVNDNDPTWGVAMDLNYDANRYNPIEVSFNGLIDTPVSFSSTKVSGLVGIGQVDTNGTAVRSGDFATVTFRNEPSKSVSAAGDVFSVALNTDYSPASPDLTIAVPGWTYDVETGNWQITSVFAVADGNSDSQVTVADITQIGQFWSQDTWVADADWRVAVGDYTQDGQITVSDISPLGQHYEEVCTGFELWAFDAADMSDTGVMLGDAILWEDGVRGTPSPAAPIADWAEVFRVWNGTVDPLGFPADTDGDEFVYVTVRAINETGNGAFVDPLVAVPAVPAPPDDVSVTGFSIQIVNATNGVDDIFVHEDTAMVPANTEVTLNIAEISGTIGGTAFVGDDANIETDVYTAAMESFEAMVVWTATNAGDAAMQMTADVLVLDTTGDDVTGMIFPDYDREIVPEGLLNAFIAATPAPNVFIPGELSYDIDIDVEMDPAAPHVVSIFSSAGMIDTEHGINALGDTQFMIAFDWGTTVPTDVADVGITLYDLTDHSEAMVFDHSTEVEPGINEYIVRDNPDPLESTKQLVAKLGGGNVVADHLYTIRLEVPPFNSVNDPGEFMKRGPYPDEVEFATIPTPDQVIDDNDYLWLFYPEPLLRRNPRAAYNILDDTITYEDEEAFLDVIKTTGDEFGYESFGDALYPKVIIRQDPDNNTDPSSIAAGDPQAPGVNQAYTCPGYIVMDILTLTTEGAPGDDPVHYDYRVFAAGAPLGFGEFTVIKELMTPGDPVGVDWGINIFDGDLTVNTRDYSNKTLDASTVGIGSGAPDVMFAEIGGGEIGAWADPLPADANMKLQFHDGSGDTKMTWDPRLAINADGTLITVHAFTVEDFAHTFPGWQGHLDTGGVYELQLLDSGDVFKSTIPGNLVVTGPNPNL